MNGRGDEPDFEVAVSKRYRRPRQFKVYATELRWVWAESAEEALEKARNMGLDVVRVEAVPS